MYKNGEESLGIFNTPAFWHHLYIYIYIIIIHSTQKRRWEFGYLLRPFRHTKNEMRIYSPITYFGFVYILLRSVVVSCCLCRLMFHDAVWCLLTFFVVFGFFDVICRLFEALWYCLLSFDFCDVFWCLMMFHYGWLMFIISLDVSWCCLMFVMFQYVWNIVRLSQMHDFLPKFGLCRDV